MTTLRTARQTLLLFTALLVSFTAWGETDIAELPTPATPGASGVDLTRASDGTLYLSWVEQEEEHVLKIARYDRDATDWGPTHTIIRSKINISTEPPHLASGLRGRVAATWLLPNATGFHAMVTTSTDHGVTWTEPARLTTESDEQEFTHLTPLARGGWLATWLDGRARTETGNTQLRARELGSTLPDTLVDERVCDCCALDSLLLPNGRIHLAYRDRSDDEQRDITHRSYSRNGWREAAAPLADGWQVNACPVNGPSLSRRSANVAVAWFTGANNTPQVLVARSNNLGRSWNQVLRLDDPTVSPTGQIDSVVLRDGSRWVGWRESTGGYALRASLPDGGRSEIIRLPSAGTSGEPPRLAILDNIAGQAPRLMVATIDQDRLRTHVISLPFDPEADDDCGCGPGTPTAIRGHPVRGEVVSLMPEKDAVLAKHEEVPGVMRAMTMQFQVDRRDLAALTPGQVFTARMERRADGRWWLFAIKVSPPAPTSG